MLHAPERSTVRSDSEEINIVENVSLDMLYSCAIRASIIFQDKEDYIRRQMMDLIPYIWTFAMRASRLLHDCQSQHHVAPRGRGKCAGYIVQDASSEYSDSSVKASLLLCLRLYAYLFKSRSFLTVTDFVPWLSLLTFVYPAFLRTRWH